MEEDRKYLEQAIALGRKGMHNNSGGPFGCVIVKEGEVIGRGFNQVLSTVDPTAHAEVVAIRDACRFLNNGDLAGCTLYASCEPCPMCLGAIYWARPDRIVFACTKEDAATIGFDDDFIYKEIPLPIQQRKIRTENKMREQAFTMMKEWLEKEDRVGY
ncbi:nucleoside deaminase [Robertkochia flava]|uniref:nucleoside deaminase n=1 Tax=Robertkochia flava TaxID=3447986 RepID=UPI001CC92DD7|nr:nucleoside deaminase [Robertkochia marina]